MSSVRLYIDADAMQRAFVTAVRAQGIDVTTAREAGMDHCPDDEHLAMASSLRRALLSFNTSDYCRLHTDWLTHGKSHAGVILAPQQKYSIGERVRRLLKLIATLSAEEMHDRLEFLTTWS